MIAAGALGLHAYANRPAVPHPVYSSAPTPAVVYGSRAVDGPGGRLACTAESADVETGAWSCTEWTILQPQQRVAPARESSTACSVRHVDQPSGRWVCDLPSVTV
jgi:hypothetical protein